MISKVRRTGLLLILTFVFSFMAHAQQINRVAPPFWWTGMHNPKLQVMLYGKDIGDLTPKIDYDGVQIDRVERLQNDNYLFVYLNISPETKPGSFNIRLNKGGQEQLSYNYQLKEREKGSAQREGFNNSDLIYLITPDRFANGDTGNDTVKGYKDTLNRNDDYARHGGDIQGVIDHLDYIDKMGYTAIWLNPVLENAMPRSSYHGYAITDYYKVDPRFGSNKLYKELSEKAKKHGIKLIMDMVMNHIGSHHWWMDDLPTPDWIHHHAHYKQTSNLRTTLQDPYASQYDKKQFTNGWFVKSMPDLNQSNPLLADYLIQNSIWWIEYAGLQGIREDTHSYSGQKFMKKWTCRIMQEYPNFNIVGEEWSMHPAVIAKWQKGSTLPDNFGSCLPSLMDFPTQHSLVQALNGKEQWGSGFQKLYENLSYDYLYPDPYNLVIFPDNHDMDRFYRQVHNDYGLFKMGITYVLTMRGIPQIYYGTEILASNEKAGDDGNIRSDFPGGWKSDSRNGFTGKGLSEKKKEAQQFVKKLANWRKNTPVVQTGKLMQYAPKRDGFYVYFRYNRKHTVMVIFNKNKKTTLLNTNEFYERVKSYTQGTDVVTGKTYDLDHLEVPGRTALVLELK